MLNAVTRDTRHSECTDTMNVSFRAPARNLGVPRTNAAFGRDSSFLSMTQRYRVAARRMTPTLSRGTEAVGYA